MTQAVLHEGVPEDAGMDPARIERVRDLCRTWIDRNDTPSLAALVARRGVVVFHEAFGVLRPGDDSPPLQRDSIFPVASCTKPITAAAIMCLVEDGLIGLNRPFIDYITEWDVPGVEGLADARVADLLCHTAGIDDLDFGAFCEAAMAAGPEFPLPEPGQHPIQSIVIHLGIGAPLTKAPGTAMLYSNIGYILLGDIVRRVSGQSFAQFAHDRIFEPLGMGDSYLQLPRDLRATRRVFRSPEAPGNEAQGWWQGIDAELNDDADLGASGVKTTAWDLAVFGQMLLNGGSYGGRRILSRASVDAMSRSQIPAGVPQIFAGISPETGERMEMIITGGGYGFGLFVFQTGDRFESNGNLISPGSIGHLGMGGANMWIDQDAELVGVYLSVSPRLNRDFILMNSDLFANAIHGAIVD